MNSDNSNVSIRSNLDQPRDKSVKIGSEYSLMLMWKWH